jgi:dTMP kinase
LNSTFPLPEALFYFQIDIDTALSRIAGREVAEIYEKREFLEKTIAAYEQVISSYEHTPAGEGMRIIRLDARLPAEEVGEQILKALLPAPE